MSYAMTMLAWGGIDLYENYVAAGQIDYLLQMVNHGAGTLYLLFINLYIYYITHY